MIYKADPKKWLPVVLERVDADQLLAFYGGTLVDDNNDPKCSQFVVWGGKVPQEMYTNNNDDTTNENFIETVIKKGNRIKLDFNCDDVGCFLK